MNTQTNNKPVEEMMLIVADYSVTYSTYKPKEKP